MPEQTNMRARHAAVLKTAKNHLDNNDVEKYWQTIADISPHYARLAGSVATGAAQGKGARERLQEAQMRKHGARFTEAEMQEVALKIANNDHSARSNNYDRSGDAGVTLSQTNIYHQEVFGGMGLNANTYSLQSLIAKMGDKADEIVDTDPNFFIENGKRAGIPSTELMSTFISYGGDSADAVLQDILGTDAITPQDDFDDNDTDQGFGPHSDSVPGAPEDNKVDVEPALSPEVVKLRDALMPTDADVTGPGGLMQKRTEDLTEDEVSALHGAAFDERDSATRHAIQNRLRDFYRLTYGDEPAQHDETGKMLPPVAKRNIPKQPSPVRAPTGETLADGLGRIAKVMVQAAGKDGGAGIVKSLQSGLNMMGRRLKVDGAAGPKTRAAVTETIAKNGSDRVAAAAALGRFKSFAADAKAKPEKARNLRAIVQRDVQPMLKADAGRDDDGGEAAAAKALQRGINRLNPAAQLREDGKIGPKTAAAFQSTLADTDEDTVTKRFATSLGFED